VNVLHHHVNGNPQTVEGQVRPRRQFVPIARVVGNNDQQVNVALIVGIASRTRTEQVYFQRLDRADQPSHNIVQ